MRCPTCDFNNMPGAAACGRCGSSLQANALAIDVHPPRASANARFWRGLFPSRLAYRLRDEARQIRSSAGQSVQRSGFTVPPLGVFLRMLIPGWALLHESQHERGWVFFIPGLALWFMSLATLGSALGNLCLGLAFGLHVGSCLSVMRRAGATTFGARLGLTAMIAAGLLVALYLPAGILIASVAHPLHLNLAGEPLAPGDVLIANPRAFLRSAPQPGDVVIHRRSFRQFRAHPGAEPYWVAEGEIIDRVLAGPGDTARWDQGRLWVNDRESPHKPLNARRWPGPMKWSIPAGHYLILPSTSVAINAQVPLSILEQIGIVPAADIQGRVYFRTAPLSRWGRIP
jgi:multidrug transporter EmrE-like cation transporter